MSEIKSLKTSRHINAFVGSIAPFVIICTSPDQATYVANKFLSNSTPVSTNRGAMFYTGTYKGIDITIATSGIGQPSILIYAFELFDTYNVHTIVHIGSCGALARDIKVGDFISLIDAYTDNGMAFPADQKKPISRSSPTILAAIRNKAAELKIPLKERRGFINDFFYNEGSGELEARDKHDCSVVSMESKILFDVAKNFDRNAASLLFVVDAVLDLEERRNAGEKLEIDPLLMTPVPGMDSLFLLALESAVKFSEKN